MTRDEWIEFSCFPVQQPIGEFYVGSIDANDLVAISYGDVRRIDERDVEKYLGIQRPLDQSRVAELRKYVRTEDAAFPTGVLLAISSADAEFDTGSGSMRVRRDESVAKIIDGQHRIAGLVGFEGSFQSIVTIFVDMELEDQANVFATINLKQTKVNRSLAYDLFEFAKARSPQKSAHNIARLLNFERESPLRGRIKLLGVASRARSGETLTQALVVDHLLSLITDDPLTDRDLLRRGRKIPLLKEWRRLPFRNLFIQEQDAVIARNVWNLFAAVDRRWPAAWRQVEVGFILNRTTGFSALMRFLGVAYPILSPKQGLIGEDEFYSILSKVNLRDADMTRERFVPGSSGINSLFRVLTETLPKGG
jgi:DGQHR domain-containing protein